MGFADGRWRLAHTDSAAGQSALGPTSIVSITASRPTSPCGTRCSGAASRFSLWHAQRPIARAQFIHPSRKNFPSYLLHLAAPQITRADVRPSRRTNRFVFRPPQFKFKKICHSPETPCQKGDRTIRRGVFSSSCVLNPGACTSVFDSRQRCGEVARACTTPHTKVPKELVRGIEVGRIACAVWVKRAGEVATLVFLRLPLLRSVASNGMAFDQGLSIDGSGESNRCRSCWLESIPRDNSEKTVGSIFPVIEEMLNPASLV